MTHTDIDRIQSVEQLDDLLSTPTPGVIETMAKLKGDIIVLGVGGKMGPTIATMAKRASDAANTKRRIIGVSRFSSKAAEELLNGQGIDTIKADLLDFDALDKLPDAPNILYMAGLKFGSTGNEPLLWAMNCLLPGAVCRKYQRSKIVSFSTGNVYGLVPLASGGSIESDTPNPFGDYAMSCLGRDRVFEHYSIAHKVPSAIIRLNYACELRYGVLVDLARQVWSGQTINLAMGNFNVIWQGDANAMTLQSFDRASSPAFYINIAGPELMSVRRVCDQFGKLMNKEVAFEGEENRDALLNNAQLSHELFGYPHVPVKRMIQWIAHWIMEDKASLGKPTHFEVRDGKF